YLQYTMTVENGGPDTATGVTLSDPLPAGVTFLAASSGQGSCTMAGGTLICSLGNLLNGGSTTGLLLLTPHPPPTPTHTAIVDANELDPDPLNNASTASTTVLAPTATPTRTPTNTPAPAVTPTDTPTATPVPPTNTPSPRDTPSPTPSSTTTSTATRTPS